MSSGSSSYDDFLRLPRRIFIDSSVLQNIHKYGEVLFEDQELSADASVRKWQQGPDEIMALRNILVVAGRADFQFAVSRNSLKEVAHKADSSFLNWAREMFWHWEENLAWSGIPKPVEAESMCSKLDGDCFAYLSAGDRSLLRDAIAFGCDAFLTMDFKLRKNSSHVRRELGIMLLSPSDYWILIRPWAALYV